MKPSSRGAAKNLLRLTGGRLHTFPVLLPLAATAVLAAIGLLAASSWRRHPRAQRQQRPLEPLLLRTTLFNQITHAISERLGLDDAMTQVLESLVSQLPVDFCAVALPPPDSAGLVLRHAAHRAGSEAGVALVQADLRLRIDPATLSALPESGLLRPPRLDAIDAEWARRLAGCGLHSAVLILLASQDVGLGMMLVARGGFDAFQPDECAFLQQLAEHVGLVARQAQLYDDLRSAHAQLQASQQTVLQQERLIALARMATSVANDINNAISPISLYGEALLDSEPGLSDRARTYLRVMQDAVDDVVATITAMRDFSRSRDPFVALHSLPINELVCSSAEQALWRRKSEREPGGPVQLQFRLEPALSALAVAGDDLREALQHLADNAIDSMPDGGTLTLSTALVRQPDGSSEVEVTVADTGIGMDEATRLHCIEPFYSSKDRRGAGLGLAAVYGITQRCGARMEIDSAPRAGSRVRLFFSISAPDSAR